MLGILVLSVDFDGDSTSNLRTTGYITRSKSQGMMQKSTASQGDPGIHLFATPSIILVPTVDFNGSTTSDLGKTLATSYTTRGKG